MNKLDEVNREIDYQLRHIDDLIKGNKLPCCSYKFWDKWLSNVGNENIEFIKSYDKNKLTAEMIGVIEYELYKVKQMTELQNDLSYIQYLDVCIESLASFIEEIYFALMEV